MIPRGWEAMTVGEVFPTIGGGTPSTRIPEFWMGTIPWVTSADLHEDGTIVARKRITESAIAASATNLVPAGSVVVATRVGLGKVALAREPLCFSQDCTALLINGDGLHPQFVRLQMQRTSATFRGRGTTINGITKKQLLDTPFLVAPTLEQDRIVEAIESYFTRLDDAVATLDRVQRNLKRYRASVLKAAVDGRLVPTEAEMARVEGRDYEPASVLLERVLAERRRRWEASGHKGRYVEPIAPDAGEQPELPQGWCWTNLGTLFDVVVGATPSRTKPEFWGGDIPWVSSGEVAFCRIRSTSEKITEAGLENSSTKLNPRGTVLIGMIGEGRTRGQVAILDIAACNNQNAAAIRVSAAGLPAEYVYYYLMSTYEVTRGLGSGNNQPALNKARVQAIRMPLPPLAEQHRIV